MKKSAEQKCEKTETYFTRAVEKDVQAQELKNCAPCAAMPNEAKVIDD